MDKRCFIKAKLCEGEIYGATNRMPLLPGLLWQSLNLALIVQWLLRSDFFSFFPPNFTSSSAILACLHGYAYPRLKTTAIESYITVKILFWYILTEADFVNKCLLGTGHDICIDIHWLKYNTQPTKPILFKSLVSLLYLPFYVKHYLPRSKFSTAVLFCVT
jgi:hypothetical protein